jgi:hypothetical protein
MHMTADAFEEALTELGWTRHEAAVTLNVKAGGSRVGEWARGHREVPGYIASGITAHLELHRLRKEVDDLRVQVEEWAASASKLGDRKIPASKLRSRLQSIGWRLAEALQ